MPHLLMVVVFVWGIAASHSCSWAEEPERSIDQLVEQLGNAEDWESRKSAADELGRRGAEAAEAIDALHKACEDPQPDVRAAALMATAATGAKPEASIELMVSALDDPAGVLTSGRLVYTYAGQALGTYGGRVVDRLIELLDSPKVIRVRGAAIALAEIGPDAAKAVPALTKVLEKDHPATRIHVLNALKEIGPPSKPAMDLMIKALDSDDFHTQYWSCRALGALGAEAEPAVPKLIELLTTGVTSVRRNAAQALGNIGPVAGERVVEPLLGLVRDRNQAVREDAIEALGKLGKLAAPATSALEGVLDDPSFDSRARSRAAKALWLLDRDNERSIPTLLKELQSPDAPWIAAEAIGDIGAEAGVVLDVVGLLHESNPETRTFAAEALARMGAGAEQAIPTLEDLAADDSNPEAQEAAAAALAAIRQAVEQAGQEP